MIHETLPSRTQPAHWDSEDDLGPEDLVPIQRPLSPADRFWASLERAAAPSDAAMSDDVEDAPTEEVPVVVARERSSGWSCR